MSSSESFTQLVISFWDANWWWLIFVVPSLLSGFFGGARDFFLDLARIITGNRDNEPAITPPAVKMELAPPVPAPPCTHSTAVEVRETLPGGLEGKRVAWYCAKCDEQLPADWALTPQDLKNRRSESEH